MNKARSEKQQYWLNHIEAANESGLSLVEYARTNNLKAQHLYQWRSALKNESISVATETQFTRVVTTTPAASNQLTLRTANVALEFDTLPDALWLAAVLSSVVPAK